MKHFYHLLELLFMLLEPAFAEAAARPDQFPYTVAFSEADPGHGGKNRTPASNVPPASGAKSGPVVGGASAKPAFGDVKTIPASGVGSAKPASGEAKTASIARAAARSAAAKRRELVDMRSVSASPVLRIFEDDDFFNIRGKGTDEGYTNGSRLDYFYVKHHGDRQADRWLMPDAGKGAVNTYGWGLMEIMYTPTNLKASAYLPGNYPYSGAMYLAHTKYSYNPLRRFAFQTELVGGLMGPAAAAGPIQYWFHGAIDYQRPEGWKNQFPNDILLNENLSVEKEILHVGRGLEWMAGATGNIGTMLDGGTVYSTVRLGWMNPYFDGWNAQYQGKGRRRFQLYVFGTPKAEWVAFNSMLEGGLISRNLDTWDQGKFENFAPRVKRGVDEIDYGLVVVIGGFSAAYTQKTASATLRGMGMHEVGNLSFFITLH
jgi:lipid A 3-O-deacylase